MVSSFRKILDLLDIFGVELQFRKEDKNTYNSLIGSILSILIYITLIILSFIFGKEIYERKLPRVNTGFEILHPNQTDINLKEDLPFSFVIRNSISLQVLPMNEYYTIDVRICDLTNAASPNVYYLNETMFSPCTSKYFSLDENENLPGINEFICFDWNNYFLRNERSVPNSFFIVMEVKLCDSSKKSCPIDLLTKTAQIFSNSIFKDTYINPKAKNSLIEGNFIKNLQVLNSDTIKYSYYKIVKNKLIADNGWILEDNIEKFHINTYISNETLVKSNKLLKTLQVLTFESSTNRQTTEIRYMKVQDLLANIGGLMNGLIMIGSILVRNYVNFSFYIDTYNLIIDFSKNSIVSEEEQFYSSLISKKYEIKEIKLQNTIKKCALENNRKKDDLDIKENKIPNQSNIKLNYKENDKINQLNINNDIVNILNKGKLNDSTIKDSSSCLNLHKDINSNSKKINDFDIDIYEKIKISVLKDVNNEMATNESKKADSKLIDLQNHLKAIESSTEYEFIDNYLVYIYESYICCKNPNKKQKNLSNYMLSYNRFVKHSMMDMANDK